MNRTPPTTEDVLAVPLLPPGPITAAGNRVRGVLGRLHVARWPRHRHEYWRDSSDSWSTGHSWSCAAPACPMR